MKKVVDERKANKTVYMERDLLALMLKYANEHSTMPEADDNVKGNFKKKMSFKEVIGIYQIMVNVDHVLIVVPSILCLCPLSLTIFAERNATVVEIESTFEECFS